MGKSTQKTGKAHSYLVFEKVTQLVARALVAIKRKKISKSKTTTMTFLYNLKKKQQYQGDKNWCYTESFMFWQSQISELLRSVLEILSFWNKFWIILCLLW